MSTNYSHLPSNSGVVFEYRYYDIDDSQCCHCRHERFKWCNIHWSCCCCQCRTSLCIISFLFFLFFVLCFLLIIAYFGGYIFGTVPQKPPCCASSHCAEFDYSAFDQILSEIVAPNRTKNGIKSSLIDYNKLIEDEALNDKFSAFLANISLFDVSLLNCESQFALFVNAYNAFMIGMILDHRTSGGFVGSVTEIRRYFGLRSVWKMNAGIIGGTMYNLYSIKHDILRKYFLKNDQNLHSLLICGALSCPDLRMKAYTESNLQTEAANALSAWLQNTSKGSKMSQEDGYLHLSKIFLWYQRDFSPNVNQFIAEHTNVKKNSIKTKKYLPFDWSLNNL